MEFSCYLSSCSYGRLPSSIKPVMVKTCKERNMLFICVWAFTTWHLGQVFKMVYAPHARSSEGTMQCCLFGVWDTNDLLKWRLPHCMPALNIVTLYVAFCPPVLPACTGCININFFLDLATQMRCF